MVMMVEIEVDGGESDDYMVVEGGGRRKSSCSFWLGVW
jgi:hypothetical protein